MANLNQFYKGEVIKVTVTDEDGGILSGQYNGDGEIDLTSGEYAGLRAYPDDLNLENGNENNIKPFSTDDGVVFSLTGEDSLQMVDGQYTLELIYGGEDDRVIVKTPHAFTLVGSAYKRKDA